MTPTLHPQHHVSGTDFGHSLNGIGAGPAETIQPTIIADVIFLHDRGKHNTLYFAVYFGSLMVLALHDIPSFLC